MKKTTRILILFSALFLVICCNKKFDEPIIISTPTGTIISIKLLKDSLSKIKDNDSTTFSITGNVTTEETNGNFYKVAYMQDTTGAVELRLNFAGGLYIGDSIIINLDSLDITFEDDKLTIENIELDKSVVKIATEKFVEPKLISFNSVDLSNDQCKLIKLSNVEFETTGITYADPSSFIGGDNANLNLKDCDGNIYKVRTSDYANFGDVLVDSGNGDITGILISYSNDLQLFIRDINEVQLDSTKCNGSSVGGGTGGGGTSGDILFKDFEDGSMTSGGWKNFWSGTNPNIGGWELYTTFGVNGPVAKASNYSSSTNYACESWLVSPLFDLTIASSPYLVFDNVTRYSGDDLELYISSNYDGVSNPDQSGTWINLTSYVPNWDTDDFSWDLVSSGNTDLTQFISPSVAIAFKYSGSDSNGATWEVDNILITE
jgi:hypothetical protein